MESMEIHRKPEVATGAAQKTNRRVKFHLFRWLTGLLNAVLIWIFLASRLWTPKGDFSHLYDGIQGTFHLPALILLPALNVAALYVVMHRELYERRKFRALLLVQSILYFAAVWALNFLLTNQADNSPQPSNGAMWGIIGVPVLLVVAASIGVGRKPSTAKLEDKILPPATSRKPSNEFGPNPLTGVGRGFWALRLNWPAAVWGLAVSTLISITTWLSTPNAGSLVPKTTTPAHYLPLALLLIGAAFITQYYLIVVAVATGRGESLKPKPAALRTLKLLPKLIVLDVIQVLAITLGFMLLVVPGIILLFRFFLARAILIGENTGPITALKFSSRLMKRNGMQVIGAWFIQVLVILLVAVATFAIKPWGSWVGTPVSLAIITGIYIFLTRLYQDLDRTKRAGFSRLRVHWLNIAFLFAWGLLIIAGIVGFNVLVDLTAHPQTTPTRTACYEIRVPSHFHVSKLSVCHLRADSQYASLEYIPVVDSATTVEKLVDHQRNSRFPSDRYHQFPGSLGQSDLPVDSEDALTYDYIDTKTGGDVTASFVHTTETFKVNGVQIRNFILVDTTKTDSASSNWGDGMFTDPNLDITQSIVFPPYGSDEFKADMQRVYDDWSQQKYQQASDDAATAAAAADNNEAKAAAFSLEGEAQAQLGDDSASMTAFDEAYALDPNNIDALDALGNQAFDQGNNAAAIRYAQQVIAQDDTYDDAYNLLAITYDAMGNSALAKKNIERALELDPQNPLYQKNAAMILNSKLRPGKDSVQLPQPPV